MEQDEQQQQPQQFKRGQVPVNKTLVAKYEKINKRDALKFIRHKKILTKKLDSRSVTDYFLRYMATEKIQFEINEYYKDK